MIRHVNSHWKALWPARSCGYVGVGGDCISRRDKEGMDLEEQLGVSPLLWLREVENDVPYPGWAVEQVGETPV